MKNIKDIVIGIFAVIGLFAIASGFSNNQNQVAQTSPESHVWEIQCYHGGGSSAVTAGRCYQYNKKTGEVRMLNRKFKEATYKVMPQE